MTFRFTGRRPSTLLLLPTDIIICVTVGKKAYNLFLVIALNTFISRSSYYLELVCLYLF